MREKRKSWADKAGFYQPPVSSPLWSEWCNLCWSGSRGTMGSAVMKETEEEEKKGRSTVITMAAGRGYSRSRKLIKNARPGPRWPTRTWLLGETGQCLTLWDQDITGRWCCSLTCKDLSDFHSFDTESLGLIESTDSDSSGFIYRVSWIIITYSSGPVSY